MRSAIGSSSSAPVKPSSSCETSASVPSTTRVNAGVRPMASSRLPQASASRLVAPVSPVASAAAGAADLALQGVEDQPLRLGGLPGLDQRADQLALRGRERDPDPPERGDPLHRVFERLAQLDRRRAQILAEHRRQILRQAERAGEGLAGDGAEGGEDRR